MNCSEFLATFSEYHDGVLSPEEREAFDAHLSACASCRRYREVVERGVKLLRSLPRERPRDDFRPRLQHALYHVDEERIRRRTSSSSLAGTGAMTLVAAVAILAGILWTPVLFDDVPAVELPPLVVNAPAPTSDAPVTPAARDFESRPFTDSNLWSQPNTLLFEHSSLHRHREGGMVRTGFQ